MNTTFALVAVQLSTICWMNRNPSNRNKHSESLSSRWFKVTFSSPGWRSLKHPKKVTKNCQGYFYHLSCPIQLVAGEGHQKASGFIYSSNTTVSCRHFPITFPLQFSGSGNRSQSPTIIGFRLRTFVDWVFCWLCVSSIILMVWKLRWSLGSQLLGSDILHVQIWSLWFNEALRRGSTSTSNGNNSGKLRRQMLKQWSLQTLPEELELLLSQKIAGWWNIHLFMAMVDGVLRLGVFLGGTQKVRLQVFVQHLAAGGDAKILNIHQFHHQEE